LCLLPFALSSAGCAKTKAASVAEGPPLAVPVAPPRVLAPVDEPLAEEAPPPPEQQPTPPATTDRQPAPRATRPPRSNTAATTPAATPEAPAEAPAQTPPVTDQPAAPRAVPTQTDTAAEKKVRDVLGKAGKDLGGVDYKKLSAQGQVQYDLSKRLGVEAETALRERKYEYAATLADKAAELATQLLGSR
jgi:hypothetical protein